MNRCRSLLAEGGGDEGLGTCVDPSSLVVVPRRLDLDPEPQESSRLRLPPLVSVTPKLGVRDGRLVSRISASLVYARKKTRTGWDWGRLDIAENENAYVIWWGVRVHVRGTKRWNLPFSIHWQH
jgi:hypothetical protein